MEAILNILMVKCCAQKEAWRSWELGVDRLYRKPGRSLLYLCHMQCLKVDPLIVLQNKVKCETSGSLGGNAFIPLL